MAMQDAPKGSRASKVKVRISANAIVIGFSAGFFRKYELSKTDAKYVRLGYDKSSGNIGVEFRKENKDGKAMLITYPENSLSGSCPVGAILTVFDLDISEIAGDYEEGDAIKANVKINGWAENGFLLITSRRKKLKKKIK